MSKKKPAAPTNKELAPEGYPAADVARLEFNGDKNNVALFTESTATPPGEGLENFDILNDHRAAWALAGLVGFNAACQGDDEKQVADLLCDLMHLLDRMPAYYGTFADNLDRARGHYEAETGKREAECQAGCGWAGPVTALNEVKHLHQRVGAGEVMPAGECPACGAVAHLIKKDAA